MKKIINDPEKVVEEFIDGLLYSRKDLVRLEDLNCVIKRVITSEKVGLVSLGGSGHEPAHAGFIGPGGLDGVACGRVFASPSVQQIYKVGQAVNSGSGVLFIVKNYTGDKLNTLAAMELLDSEGIPNKMLVVADDVAPIEGLKKEDRRGVAGTVLVHKILGNAARSYMGLNQLYDLGKDVCSQLKSAGLALSPCIIPYVGEPNFSIPEDQVTMGIGIHGEKGARDRAIDSADQLTEELLSFILQDFELEGHPLAKGERVILQINGMGATPLMELYIVNRYVCKRLEDLGVVIIRNPVGEYMTSLEMTGYSLTVLRLNINSMGLINDIG